MKYYIHLPIKYRLIVDNSAVKSKACCANVYHSNELVHLLLHAFTATLRNKQVIQKIEVNKHEVY